MGDRLSTSCMLLISKPVVTKRRVLALWRTHGKTKGSKVGFSQQKFQSSAMTLAGLCCGGIASWQEVSDAPWVL